MRTTLTIPDSIYHKAKEAARQQGRTLSEVVAEAVALQLSGHNTVVGEVKAPYKINPTSMGVPQVDVNDREALSRRIDKRQ